MDLFQEPEVLLVGVAVCIGLFLVFRRFEQLRHHVLSQFASNHLLQQLTANISETKRRWKRICFIVGIGFLFVALARPQYGFRWQEVKRKGIDILIALDTSKSMLASDIKPNRLERAKLGITDFIAKLEGDRVGLMPFAGGAHLMCPMTMDYSAFLNSLDSVDTTIIPEGGTDIANVIVQSQEVFQNDSNFKILVLITDGEDLEGEALTAAQKAAEAGVKIYTVGVGSATGELIPVPDGRGGMSYLKDSEGSFVKSRLDESMLTKIANATGGAYEPLGRQAQGLERIYKSKLDLVPKQDIAERMSKVPLERFEWPLFVAILLLVVEFMLGDRKSATVSNREKVTTAGRRSASKTASLLVAAFALGFSVQASPEDAMEAFEQGDYKLSAELYKEASEKDPDDLRLRFNYGTAAYKDGDYDKAHSAFRDVTYSDDLALQSRGYLNLAKILYKMGDEIVDEKPKETVKLWESSIKNYSAAVELDKNNTRAEKNRDLVKQKLARLIKIIEEQEKKKQEQNKDNQDQNKDDQKDQKDQKDQNKDNQDQNNEDQKDQNKDSQDQKDQKDQNKDSQDQKDGQQDQKDGQQDQQDQKDGQQDQQKQQNGQQGDEEKEEQPKGQAEPINEQQEKGDQQAATPGEEQKAGQMSKEEALRLLESLQDGEKQMPLFFAPKENKRDDKIRRDW